MDEQPTYTRDSGNLELPSDAPENIITETPAPQSPHQRPVGPPLRIIIPLVIIVIIVLVAGGSFVVFKKSGQKSTPSRITINTQSLDNGTLTKLTHQTGPNTQQQLVISPDTVFKKTVQIHDIVNTDNGVNIGGALNVNGATTLQGPALLNGNLAVRGSLSVSGSLTAPGLNVGSLGLTTLNASGNLNFGGHLVPGGAVPSVKPSVAASGGTVTISGNDTAGTITITIGNGTLLAGELAIINFTTPFTNTPKVQLTPITSTAASLSYYATRAPLLFTINTASTPTAGTTYVFDYLVTD